MTDLLERAAWLANVIALGLSVCVAAGMVGALGYYLAMLARDEWRHHRRARHRRR